MIKITPAAAEQMQKSFTSVDDNTVLRIAVRQKENGEFQLTNVLESLKEQGAKFIPGQVNSWMDCGKNKWKNSFTVLGG